MKKLMFITLFLYSSFVYSNQSDGACKKIDTFFPYKAGIVAEKSGEPEYAFDIFCNLAFKGDYRAQFKLAQYYNQGLENYIEPNKVYAVVWARIANTKILTRRKSNFIEQVMSELPDTGINQVDELYSSAIRMIPTGIRIDMKYKPLDLKKILEEHNKKQQYTGSRIKRSEPPAGLGIIE
ncbi:MAG: hypothetical protein OQJ80_10520 [Kangiella sp.]|nr:hypothetical protein [Kangiella sp.]